MEAHELPQRIEARRKKLMNNSLSITHGGQVMRTMKPDFGPDNKHHFYPRPLEEMSDDERDRWLGRTPRSKRVRGLEPRKAESRLHAMNMARKLSRRRGAKPPIEGKGVYCAKRGWWVFPQRSPKDVTLERGLFYDGVYTHPKPYHKEDEMPPAWDICLQTWDGEDISIEVHEFDARVAQGKALDKGPAGARVIDCIQIDADRGAWLAEVSAAPGAKALPPEQVDEDAEVRQHEVATCQQLPDDKPRVDGLVAAAEEAGFDYLSGDYYLGEDAKPVAEAIAIAVTRSEAGVAHAVAV